MSNHPQFFFMNHARTNHKNKLIGMAMGANAHNRSGWKFCKVENSFTHDNFAFMDTDITIIRPNKDEVEALCTRAMKVAILPLKLKDNFTILENLPDPINQIPEDALT